MSAFWNDLAFWCGGLMVGILLETLYQYRQRSKARQAYKQLKDD